MASVKVTVSIPADKKPALLAFAANLRRGAPAHRGPGWDAQEISRIAHQYFDGSYREMFEKITGEEWKGNGKLLLPRVSKFVSDEHRGVENFAAKYPDKGNGK